MAGASDLVAHFHEQHPNKPAPRESNPFSESHSSSPTPASGKIAVAFPARAPSGSAPTLTNPQIASSAPQVLSADDEIPSTVDDIDDQFDVLLMRIRPGIASTRMRNSQPLLLMQTTRFLMPRRTEEYVPTDTEVAAMMLLQAPSIPPPSSTMRLPI